MNGFSKGTPPSVANFKAIKIIAKTTNTIEAMNKAKAGPSAL